MVGVCAFSPLQIHSFRFVFGMVAVIVWRRRRRLCVWATQSPHIGEYERTCCPREHTLERNQRHISFGLLLLFLPFFVSSFCAQNEWTDLMAKRCSFALCCIRALCSSHYCISVWPLAVYGHFCKHEDDERSRQQQQKIIIVTSAGDTLCSAPC